MIVDLLPTEDQVMIAESVSRLLQDRLPVTRLRSPDAIFGRAEAGLWEELSGIGLFGIGVPEERGGVGYTLKEEILCARILGKHLASPDVLATMIGAQLAANCQNHSLLEQLISGDARFCLANSGKRIGTSVRLQVFDGGTCSHAITWNGTEIMATPLSQSHAGDAGECLDDTISLRYFEADEAPLTPESTQDAIRLSQYADTMIAAYQVGLSEAVRDMAVGYAAERVQFGQPIGAFQAIKHACANMAVNAEMSLAQTLYAAVAIDQGEPSAGEVSSARMLANRAALENARSNIQVYGGMGFTYECEAHFFLKRAHVFSEVSFDWILNREALLA